MDYYIYSPVSYRVRSELKRGVKQMNIDISGKPWQRIWIDFLQRGVVLADIATPVVFLENIWLKNPICLMPESDDLIQQLLTTNFEGQVKALRPYSEFFTIALPKTTRFNNHLIQGIFVSYISPQSYQNVVGSFNTEYGTKAVIEHTDKNDPQLCICYADPEGQGRIVLNVDLWKLEWILSAENMDEYSQLTGVNEDSVLTYDLSKEEQQTQFLILKFVIAFIVYVSAHENALEFTHDVKMAGADKDSVKAQIHVVHHFKSTNSIRPHYRNLRDSRFYQGKWSTWTPGSRWIPVNMETVKVNHNSNGV